MKHIRFLLVLVAILCLALPAFAQEEFGLSADDASLLNTAVTNSSEVDQLTFEFTASLTVAGMGDSSNVTADLTGSGGIGDGVFSMVVDGTITAEGESIPAALEVRAVDDVLYINIGGQWLSLTEEDVTSLSSMAGQSGMLPVDPSSLMEGDMSGMEGMGDMMSGLANLDPATFVSMSRLDDEGSNARFQTAFDIGALLSDPSMASIFGAAMAMNAPAGGAQPTMSPEQMQMMAQMMGAMFENATFTFDQWVDTDAQRISAAELVLDIPLAGMTGQTDSNVNINFRVDLGYDEAVSVEAPEGAVPFSEAMGAMMGGM